MYHKHLHLRKCVTLMGQSQYQALNVVDCFNSFTGKNYTIFRDYTVQAMALNYITFLLFLVFIMLLDGMLYVSLFQ